jgi:hypothetical protein
MATATDQLIDHFASKLNSLSVQIRPEDNLLRLQALEEKLPKRLPQSFTTLLSRYSFPSFDLGGITFLGWGPDHTEFSEVAPPPKGSLSELLLPAGYIQIGRPDTGDFDAVCPRAQRQSKSRIPYRPGRPRTDFVPFPRGDPA